MKVILLRDISGVGRKHEVKEVPDGHAHNYLIPRGLASAATPQNIKQQDERAARAQANREKTTETFRMFLARVADTPIVLTAPANEQGHLFKGLRAAELAKAISAAAGVAVGADAVLLSEPIKAVGEHPVPVVMGGEKGTVIVIVNAKKA